MRRLLVLATVFAMTCIAAVVGATPSNAATHASRAPAASKLGAPIERVSGGSAPGVPTIAQNWSGYAVAGKKFNFVHSRFVQPAIVCPSAANAYTSAWVGLDGFTDGTVEQDGTFAHCGGANHDTPVYQAWYELYPAGSVIVFAVKAGDVIDATVTYTGGTFALTVKDLTSNKSASKSAACASCERSSAEWIVERPALCNSSSCFITPLVNFGTTTMGQDTVKADGSSATKGITGFTNYPIYMVQNLRKGFISLDGTGPVSGNSFSVVWQREGKATPIQL